MKSAISEGFIIWILANSNSICFLFYFNWLFRQAYSGLAVQIDCFFLRIFSMTGNLDHDFEVMSADWSYSNNSYAECG